MANCLSNIRSSGLAITVYTNDYNSWTMAKHDSNWATSSSGDYWPTPLAEGNYLPAFPEAGRGYATVCPDGMTSLARDGTYSKPIASYAMRGTNTSPAYDTNFRIDAIVTNNGNAANSKPAETMTEGASKTVWLYDSCAKIGVSGGIDINAQHAGANKDSFGVWHGGKGQRARGGIMFFDGHASMELKRYGYLYKARLIDGSNYIIDDL